MENASKALLIAGAILLSILIIAIGMYIYNSAQSTIQDSIGAMSTQEKEAFNNQFVSYEGSRTGSQVKALLGILTGNASTYEDEVGKIPAVNVPEQITVRGAQAGQAITADQPDTAGDTEDYFNQISIIRNNVEDKHTYWIEMNVGTSGLINEIVIHYERPE